jgi:hypothetical protein
MNSLIPHRGRSRIVKLANGVAKQETPHEAAFLAMRLDIVTMSASVT